MISKLRFALFAVLFLVAAKTFGQAPNISYPTPQVYTLNTAITPLSPTNTGGAILTQAAVYFRPGSFYENVTGLAFDASGDIFIADDEQTTIQEVTAGGTVLTLGSGFSIPISVAVDASGNVYVVNHGDGTVKKIPAGNGTVQTIGTGFNLPDAITIDQSGNIYVSDTNNNAIKEIPAGGGTPITIATGLNALSIAVDAAGNVYAADEEHNAIDKVIAGSGTVTKLAAGNGAPSGVIVDAAGNVYFSDFRVSYITELPAGGGSAIQIGSGLGNEETLAFDPGNNIFVGEGTEIQEIPNSGYIVSPELPVGLTLNHITGVITGTPSQITAAANYSVTGYNGAARSTAVVNIAVSLPVKPNISYQTPQTYIVADTIPPLVPVNTGANATWSVTPALPSGLTLNTVNGEISGVPSATSASTNYTVSATNTGGTGTTVINITVGLPAKPVISYNGPQTFVLSAPIAQLNPKNTGGAPVSYAISPVLPAGLSFSNSAGIITGTPTKVTAAANYTITATNAGGSATTTLNITIATAAAPHFTYVTPQTYPIGTAVSLSPTNYGGAVSPRAPILVNQGLKINGFALDASDNIYAAAGTIVFNVLSGVQTYIGSGFTKATGIAITSTGIAYVVDYSNNDIKRIPASGGAAVEISTSFSHPYGIAIDASGNLFITDQGTNSVKEIPAGTTTVNVIATGLNNPTGIALDASGNMYVADNGSNTIKKIPAGGGTPVTVATANGSPYGVAVDASGNIFYADATQTSLIEVPANGGPYLAIGSGLSSLTCVVIDASGNFFIGEGSGTNGAIFEILKNTGFSVSPTLPAGLTIDQNTGVISGTPTTVSAATTYTVTGLNATGSGSATISIAVTAPAAPAISYPTPQVFAINTTTSTIQPTSTGGAVISYSISPALPAGLTLNTTTGAIFGTPTTVTPAANYTVSATNITGTATAVINITVSANAAPNISYTSPQVYALGTAIAPLYPQNTGGAVTGTYTVTPTLPRGLSFVDSSGVIQGTPTILSPATTYTILTYNGTDTSTTTIKIGVNPPQKPDISYSKTPFVFTQSNSVGTNTPTNIGGPVTTAVPLGGNAYTYSHPRGVAVDAAGNVFIADNQFNDVFEIPVNGAPRFRVGSGYVSPTGVAVDASGNVYVADGGNNAIKEVLKADGSVVTLASGLSFPYGVALDAAGNIYFTEIGTNSVKKIAAGGGSPITLATGFNKPCGLTVDASGNIYVADNGNALIKEIPAAGGALVPFGTGLVTPYDVAVDASGNLYVADHDAMAVDLISGGVTSPFYAPTVAYVRPISITLDRSGNVYFEDDRSFNVIEIFMPANYTISPALPRGISISPVTGAITGTPSVTSAATTYTVNASNISGTATTMFSITVNPPDKLADLSLSAGHLNEAFTGGVYNYTAKEVYTQTSITVTPTAANTSETITVNGTTVTSGSASAAIPLNVGSNTITVIVTASSATTTYTITVTRAAQTTDASLSALSINVGTLSPAFTFNNTSYTVNVPYSSSTVKITPTVNSAGETVKVSGVSTASGTASVGIPAAVGNTTIPVGVTSSDGTTRMTYYIVVTRAASNNANLSSLTLSKGTLSPAFAAGITSYSDMVSNGNASVTVTPTVADPTATVKVNGTVVASGSASAAIPLTVGSNLVTVLVTAQGGSTTVTYTVNVIRPSTNAKLSNLTISYGMLTPVFNTDSVKYSEFVPYSVSTMTLTPTATVSGSTITVNGIAVASGSAATPVTLNVGTTTISTVVTAQDGVTTNTYTLIITRPAGSTNANLAGLTVSKGTLTPAFALSTTAYTDMVTNGTTSLTMTPTVSSTYATVTINGTAVASGHASGPITLAVGSNMVTVVVTAQNGTNTKTYKITVIRPSTNAKLSAFTISSGTLTPAFNTNTTSYTASVTNATSSITVKPTVAVTGATIKVNGTTVASGSSSAAIALSVGSNTITTVVTAQDGTTTDTYTLTVTRAAGSENIPDAAVSVDKPVETIQLAEDGVNVHQGISPNGDGINDFLQIDNIANYPENHLSIMNRNGQLVYEAKGYDNATKAFDGHSNKSGQMQLPGTYFYSLDYTIDGVAKHKTGFLVLKY